MTNIDDLTIKIADFTSVWRFFGSGVTVGSIRSDLAVFSSPTFFFFEEDLATYPAAIGKNVRMKQSANF